MKAPTITHLAPYAHDPREGWRCFTGESQLDRPQHQCDYDDEIRRALAWRRAIGATVFGWEDGHPMFLSHNMDAVEDPCGAALPLSVAVRGVTSPETPPWDWAGRCDIPAFMST